MTDKHEIADYEMKDFLRSIRFSVRYNRSDSTCGWNGARDAFRVFYLHHPLEFSYTSTSDSSHTLIHGITPHVHYQIRTRKYLGLPYTDCNPSHNYTQRIGKSHLHISLYSKRRDFKVRGQFREPKVP